MANIGLVFKTDGTVEAKEFGSPLHKSLGAAVNGYIEIVRPMFGVQAGIVTKSMIMVINEEGKLEGLQPNLIATLLYAGPKATVALLMGVIPDSDFIVGDMVLMKERGEDIIGLTDAEIIQIREVLAGSVQARQRR